MTWRWTLDVGSEASVNVAARDAYRAEVLAPDEPGVLNSTRPGFRVSPEHLATRRRPLRELVVEIADHDDPDGQPVSLYIGLHERGDLDAVASDEADDEEEVRS